MPDLKRYRAKRDPERSPEPFGDGPEARALPAGALHQFVVQQHDARNMHWDLRLEIAGVLVSWAVPRGPSLDPTQKRLAVQTEDHPLEYAEFEGIIPRGNYGAGAMIVWDRGAYATVDGVHPSQGLEDGKLDLVLHGHKLTGRFALVRTRGEGGRSWLLLRKGGPPDESIELIESRPASVLSGLTVEQLRDGVTRDAQLAPLLASAPRHAPDLRKLRPMLAGTREDAFSKDGWLFELKYDGMRVLASRDAQGEVKLISRTGRDASATYPEVSRALAHLPLCEFVLDGELVCLDERGHSSFERIQSRFGLSDAESIARAEVERPVILYAFDLLFALGHDLRGLPLVRRKELLLIFVPRHGQVRFADHVEADGAALFEAAREHEMEGVIAKRADSKYETGRRSKSWLKIKVPRSSKLVIVGWNEGKGARAPLGSLALGWYQGGRLVFAGNAGSGLDERTIAQLLPALEQIRVEQPAFAGAIEPRPEGAHYVDPQLVCRARFTEVTSTGLLRHPVFDGLLPEARAEDCLAPGQRTVEAIAAPAATAPRPSEQELRLTRLDKVFWPVEGYTKGDLLGFYESVWPWLEPYLRDRPLVLTRYPDGIDGKFFYQKNAPEFTPDWVERENIEGTDYFICNELRELLYVINSGAIPLHVWSARRPRLDHPDWLILDLDPKQAPFADVVKIARHTHALLEELGAAHFVKTSGQDGLHILLPMGARLDHADVRRLAEVLARVIAAALPEIATIARPIAARGDKVYVDYLQNGRGALLAAPFSVRPRPGAPVSMPLGWSQVTARLAPARWTIKSVVKRLAAQGDPFRGVLGEPVDVDALLQALVQKLEETPG